MLVAVSMQSQFGIMFNVRVALILWRTKKRVVYVLGFYLYLHLFPRKLFIAIFIVKKGHMVQNYLSFIWYESIFHLLTFIWNLPVTKYDSSWLSGELKWYITKDAMSTLIIILVKVNFILLIWIDKWNN